MPPAFRSFYVKEFRRSDARPIDYPSRPDDDVCFPANVPCPGKWGLILEGPAAKSAADTNERNRTYTYQERGYPPHSPPTIISSFQRYWPWTQRAGIGFKGVEGENAKIFLWPDHAGMSIYTDISGPRDLVLVVLELLMQPGHLTKGFCLSLFR